MNLQLFVESLLTGTPLAILVGLVGMFWQSMYARSRDRFNDEQARRTQALETQRFQHQKEMETLRFEYEQLRWREQLAHDITVKIVEERIQEFSKVWSVLEHITVHPLGDKAFTPDVAKVLAQQIKQWRFTKGGLLAEDTTRDAAYALQNALWNWEGSSETYRKRVRVARTVFRDALRADAGLGDTVFEKTKERQKIREELNALQSDLGIKPADGSAK